MPTNNALFVDTSGWITYFDADDPHHANVSAVIASAIKKQTRLVTSNYIVTEVVALIVSRRLRQTHAIMVAHINAIKTDPHSDLLHIDSATDSEAWNVLVARPDKLWSLVDAASFVLMRRLGITEALTPDHHFEQAGFSIRTTP